MDDALPYVDEHTVTVVAPRDRVWSALQRYVSDSLATPRHHPLAGVLGASPPSGFRVTRTEAGERLALIETRVHALVTRRMLGRVRKASEGAT